MSETYRPGESALPSKRKKTTKRRMNDLPPTSIRRLSLVELMSRLPRPFPSDDGLPAIPLPDYRLTAKGGYAQSQPASLPNVDAVLTFFGVKMRMNMMTHRIEFEFPGIAVMDDEVAFSAIEMIMEWANIRDSVRIGNTLKALAMLDRYHPAEPWLLATPWDGKDHVTALANSLPVDDKSIACAYLWRFFVQMVEGARGWARDVPSQKDFVPVLVGKQGLYKTSWIRSLVPSQFVNTGVSLELNSFGARDSVHQALIYWLVELGELETTFTRSEQGHLKNFLSRATDVYRLPYARMENAWPRQTCFMASINHMEFLRDGTGSRRFGPIVITGHMPKATDVVDIQQLFAQANVAWEAGEGWTLTDKEDKEREDRSTMFVESNEVEDRMQEYFGFRIDSVPLYYWLPLTFSQICEVCELKPVATNASRISMWLADRGIRRLGQKSVPELGIVSRRCWLLPVADHDVSRLFPGVSGDRYKKILGPVKVVK